MTEPLRDKDWAVLQAVSEGCDDAQKIKSATTLENHEIRYSLKKLESLDLVNLEKPDRMVERLVDGQKRVFQAPTEAELTSNGKDLLGQSSSESIEEYSDLTHTELVEKVRQLETQIEELQQNFDLFRKQVQKRLNK